ncbi:hypothetical protein BO79DRAFT_205977 [Aspergillus costaricaensis CBS 115574]|uniref:uncharacterized protein n=1 Tax=Aspergillus costaricaensis CBS 115574 TaxID=1448317 RepID=UPI000DBD502C|nr:hypothetical protein BO79DRAFT_205977 [Aspergillus costaricaensis CBS 115574]RAK94045.1 hypothetical protein BO79DRAFT_205977 [Aspergillus costaricaensis CBS 115574]
MPLRQSSPIVSPIMPYGSRCLSPYLPHRQLSGEPSQHPPLTSNTTPIVVHRAVSCTMKYFVTSIPGNKQWPDNHAHYGMKSKDIMSTPRTKLKML